MGLLHEAGSTITLNWSLKTTNVYFSSALVTVLTAEDRRTVPKVVWRAVLLICFTEHWSHEMLLGKSSVAK